MTEQPSTPYKSKTGLCALSATVPGWLCLHSTTSISRPLLSKYYSTLSRLLNSAITITEQIMLDEYDLKSLDYSIRSTSPIWGNSTASSASSRQRIKPARSRPCSCRKRLSKNRNAHRSAVSIGWQWEDVAIYITASAAPASDLDVVITPYTYDGVAPRTANDHLSCRADESDRPDDYANSRRNRK